MSTRAMITVQWRPKGQYELLYRHLDGTPRVLGVELIRNLVQTPLRNALAKLHGVKKTGKFVAKPEQAFTKVQSDLEWIYVVRDNIIPGLISLEILKTSCPYLRRRFAWAVWLSNIHCVTNMKRIASQMAAVEHNSATILEMVAAIEKSQKEMGKRKEKSSEQDNDKKI